MQAASEHKVALVLPGDGRVEAREISAPDLEKLCRKNPEHPKARSVSRSSKRGLLREGQDLVGLVGQHPVGLRGVEPILVLLKQPLEQLQLLN